MQRISLRHEFPYSLEQVMAARARRYDDIERFSELKGQKVLEEKTENNIRFVRRQLSLGDKIPEVFKTLVPADKLHLLEESHFNIETNINDFEVFLDGHKDKMLIKGKTVYRVEGDAKASRTYDLVLTVNVPLIGGLLAGQLKAQYEKGLEKDYNLLMQLLDEG